jgi:HSP20 family protein
MQTLEKWAPLRDLDLMERRMRRFFGDYGLAPPVVPAADVYEAKNELVVELEVPGYDEKELEIEVSDHTLRVTGQRTAETDKKDRTMRVRERLASRFERTFELPVDVDSQRVHASYAKGVLTLTAPRAKGATRKIEIGK